jgi:Protein of unknown function (DUF1302)
MVQRRCEEAIKLLRRSFRLSPRVLTLIPLGQCYERTGKLDKAKAIYERILKSRSRSIDKVRVRSWLEEINKPKAPLTSPTEQDKDQKGAKNDDEPAIEPETSIDLGKDTVEEIGENAEATQDIGDDGGGGGSGEVGVEEITGSLSGYFRSSLDLDLEHQYATNRTDIPEDSLELRNSLLLRVLVRYGTTLQATSTLMLDHYLRARPPNDGTFLVFNAEDARSEFDASIVEAYFNFSLSPVEFRAGMLRVPWGKSDYTSPNDVVNPRDLRNPFREDLEVLRIPVLAAEISLSLPPFALSVVWQPFFRPDRMTLYGADFGIINQNLPAPVRGLTRFINGLHDPAVNAEVTEVLMQTDFPKEDPRSSSVGLKVSAQWRGIEFAGYYHYGWDTSPRLTISPQVLQALGSLDWERARLQDLGPLLQLADSGVPLYESDYIRRHHTGLDASTTVGSFLLRGEVGYDTKRVFYDQMLGSHVRGAIAAGLGVEYQLSLGKVFLLEATYLGILDAPDDLLFYRSHTVGFGAMASWSFLKGDLLTEVRAFFSAVPWTIIVRPQVTYRLHSRISVYTGVLVLAGDDFTLGGYFNRNDLFLFGCKVKI